MRTSLRWLAALLLLPAAAGADPVPPPPLGIPELTGPRTLALSAGVGLASGTEALALNPGALAARRRYAGDATFLLDQRPEQPGTKAEDGQYFGAGVVDAVTTPAAVGVNYIRAQQGPYTGNIYAGGFALPAGKDMFLGVGGRYLQLDGAEKVRTWTADVGLLWQATQHVSLGGAAYNVLSTYHRETAPRGYGVGLTAGSEQGLQLTADWRSYDLPQGTDKQFGGGLELLLRNVYVLRGGYRIDDRPEGKQQWWSAGAGLITARLALEVGYRQNLDVTAARTLAVSLRGFLPPE